MGYQVVEGGEVKGHGETGRVRSPQALVVEEQGGGRVDKKDQLEQQGVQGVDKLESLSLAWAFCRSVAATTGELRLSDRQRDAADRLAAAGVTTDQVSRATAEAATEAQRRGSPAPQTLQQVAIQKGLI
jgi:hypothetical protein